MALASPPSTPASPPVSTPPTSARGLPSSPPPAPIKPPLVRVVVVDPFQRTVRFATLPAREPGALDSYAVADRLCYDLFDTDDYAPPPFAPRVATVFLRDDPVEDYFMEVKAHTWAFPDHAPDMRLPGFKMCGVTFWGKAVLFRHYTRTGTVESMAASDIPAVAWLPPRVIAAPAVPAAVPAAVPDCSV